MRVVLDTSVLLGGALDRAMSDDTEVAISAASLAELHFGVLVARTPQTRADRLLKLAECEREFDALPLDEEVARQYGRAAAAVAAAGRQPRARVMDLWIAATAAAHDAAVWTHNLSDFEGLESIGEVIDPAAGNDL